jgi:DNA-binding PadR family transcriptional regulator
MNDSIGKFSPLTEATFYILLSLTEPLHGYGILKKVEEMSGGRLKLAAGTLYGALSTLERNKLIVLMGEDEKNKRRKLYQMTESGRDLIRFEIERLGEMVRNGLEEIGE